MLKLKQWGHNPEYPIEAEVWTPGEPVPEWLSDNAKISGFKDNGEIILDSYRDKTGALHIKDTYKPTDLVVIPKDHILIFGNGIMKVLSQEQMDFLY